MGLYFKLRKKYQISVFPHKGRLSNWTPHGIFNDSCTDCIQFPIFWGDNEISVTDNQPIEKRGNITWQSASYRRKNWYTVVIYSLRCLFVLTRGKKKTSFTEGERREGCGCSAEREHLGSQVLQQLRKLLKELMALVLLPLLQVITHLGWFFFFFFFFFLLFLERKVRYGFLFFLNCYCCITNQLWRIWVGFLCWMQEFQCSVGNYPFCSLFFVVCIYLNYINIRSQSCRYCPLWTGSKRVFICLIPPFRGI